MVDNFSSSEEDNTEKITYIPCHLEEDEELECSDEAYETLEYYTPEWPSQTIEAYQNDKVVIATNPENETPKIVVLNMKNLLKDDFISQEIYVKNSFNRIKTNININCVSDTTCEIYNESLENLCSLEYVDGLSYGLCVDKENVYFSESSGNVIKFSDRIIDQINVHVSSVESLCVFDNLMFSGSTDMSMKATDLRTKSNVLTKKATCDINTVDYNDDNLIAYGDDDGIINVFDLRNTNQPLNILWHKSSVSMIKWKDTDIFFSASDEQICVFDMSLEDEWEYEKYLLFVHQGQKYYKDICFNPLDQDIVCTTSVDGLCFFKPISFSSE